MYDIRSAMLNIGIVFTPGKFKINLEKTWKTPGILVNLRSTDPVTGSRLTGYIVNVMRSPVIERLMVRGSQVALKHIIHDMEARTLVMELRRRAIKRWVPCGDMDRRLKIPHSAKAECGFRTTPEECLYNSGAIGPHNTIIQYNTIV